MTMPMTAHLQFLAAIVLLAHLAHAAEVTKNQGGYSPIIPPVVGVHYGTHQRQVLISNKAVSGKSAPFAKSV